jgi:hypothetical protein
MHTKAYSLVGKLEGRDLLEDLGIDGRRKLKFILILGVDWIDLA